MYVRLLTPGHVASVGVPNPLKIENSCAISCKNIRVRQKCSYRNYMLPDTYAANQLNQLNGAQKK